MPGLVWSPTQRHNLARPQPGFPSSALPGLAFMDRGSPGAKMERSPRWLTRHTATPSFPLAEPWSSCQAQHLCHLARCGSKNNFRSTWIWFSARANGTPVHSQDPGSCWVWVAATHLLEGVGSIRFFFFAFCFWNVSIFPSLSGKTMTCRPVGLPVGTKRPLLPITQMVQACSFPGADVTTCHKLGG